MSHKKITEPILNSTFDWYIRMYIHTIMEPSYVAS